MREPSPKCSPEEFCRLADGLRLGRLAEILAVTPQMVGRYRTKGAPQFRVERLHQFLDRKKQEDQTTAA